MDLQKPDSTTGIFEDLLEAKRDAKLELHKDDARLILCPDMGGRTFAEVCGLSMHRIEIGCVRKPDQPFNNFGGGNFWPAPEGGKFGLNHEGDAWVVQRAINNEPFAIVSQSGDSAVIEKTIRLTNSAGTVIETLMRREISLVDQLLEPLQTAQHIKGWLTYKSIDSFEVLNEVSVEDGLISSWTLEQFDTSESTQAFCIVEDPRNAINFDYYEHPGERISYFPRGFTYKTDGQCTGQIGIKVGAQASFIGAVDSARGTVCIRKNLSPSDGLFFNIADNDQPGGPYAAADNYSIFNSNPEMQAFELETVSGARVADGLLKGSEVISMTSFAVFDEPTEAVRLVDGLLNNKA